MYSLYERRYKIASLINVFVFMAVVSGVSILYGKAQVLHGQSETSADDRVRLLKHEDDLSKAQETIAGLVAELEKLRNEVESQRQANERLEEKLQGVLKP